MTSYDLLIVGGGIIGLTIARQGAKAGLDVCLVERGSFGCGTTSVSAGMLAPNCEANPAERELFRLTSEALLRWPSFAATLEKETGIHVDYRSAGTLIVARDHDELTILQREAELRRELGYNPTELLSGQARRLEPGLAPTIRGALEVPEDHAVNPRKVVQALQHQLAQTANVHLRAETDVAELIIDNDCHGVRLADGEIIEATHTVVAASVWSKTLAGLPDGVDIPVRPVKGQVLRLEPLHKQPPPTERTIRYASGGGYLVPRSNGSCTIGATVEEQGYDTNTTGEGIFKLLEATMEIVPCALALTLQETAAGLRPATPDNRPLLGPTSGIDRLLWATGHYRNGILLAPLTAELILQAIEGVPVPTVVAADRFAR